MNHGRTRTNMRRVAAVAVIGLAVSACSVESGGDGDGEVALEDDTGSVLVTGAETGDEGAAIGEVMEIAGENAGTDVSFEGSDSFEQDVIIQIEGGTPPDVAFFPQPGAVVEQGAQGNAVALEDVGVDVGELEARFGEYLMSLGEVDGKHYGWPGVINFKSAIWYNVPAWEDAGWEFPETWEELMALQQEMIDDGTAAPWCIGTGSEAATGWPATDWMEDIVLRSQGADVYDQWVDHEVPFASEEITSAAETFGEVLFTDGAVFGGNANITGTDFRDAPDPMFAEPPNCWMHRQATFIPAFFPDGLEAETDYNFFPFPDIDGNSGALMAGTLGVIFEPRQEVIDFMMQYTSPEVGCEFGSRPGTTVIPANFNTDPECEQNTIIRQAETELYQSLQDGVARFDASDLMPPAVGSGEFWVGMNNYTDDGPDNLQSVLESIDAAWPEDG